MCPSPCGTLLFAPSSPRGALLTCDDVLKAHLRRVRGRGCVGKEEGVLCRQSQRSACALALRSTV